MEEQEQPKQEEKQERPFSDREEGGPTADESSDEEQRGSATGTRPSGFEPDEMTGSPEDGGEVSDS